jgi:MFS family permease
VLNGIAAGNLATLTAAAADLSSPANRSKTMGAVGAAFGIGFIAGPALGGLAFAFLPDLTDLFPGANPFSACALVAALLTFVNLLWIIFRFQETLPPEKRGGPVEGERSINPFRLFKPLAKGLGKLNAAWFCFMIAFTTMEAGIAFLVKDLLGYGPAGLAWLFVAVGLTSAAIQGGVVRRIGDRFSERTLALGGLALIIPGMVVIGSNAVTANSILAYGGAMLVAAGAGFVMPSVTAMVSRAVPGSSQGRAMGQFRGLGALARVVGPLFCAGTYALIGPAAPFVAAAALALVPVALLVVVRVPQAVEGENSDDGT